MSQYARSKADNEQSRRSDCSLRVTGVYLDAIREAPAARLAPALLAVHKST